MKVFRFMSKEEFKKYKAGELLENNKKHESKTSSVGFCFFDIKDFEPKNAMHFLSGIVSFDVCAVFEVDKKILNKTYGVYASPIKRTGDIEELINLLKGLNDKFTATEYCTTKYNNKDFKLVKYTENLWDQWLLYDEQEELDWKRGA